MIRDFTSLLAIIAFSSVFMFWADIAASVNGTKQPEQFAQVEASR